ncbi:helix-turn-helix transcriptional regulator [Promicromonospora sukumoe]|uniref:helix-turn-helix transcriptional regulator n=1 Tax=Promicromonospora sukumoe TaxID=88382 RepID=UPI00365785FE
MIDRAGLAAFLRHRRQLLQPEDVGLPRGNRRRTSGLRREEAALLCNMSADYYARLERERGPQPSAQMVAAIAQGLHLSIDERDYLYRVAGHNAPPRGAVGEHVSPGLLRIFDRIEDSPAEIATELMETLRQNRLSIALSGDRTGYTGPARSAIYRWFTEPTDRRRFAADDHTLWSRMFATQLRGIVALRGRGSRAAFIADLLHTESADFRATWAVHEVCVPPGELIRFDHPELGPLELDCQFTIDPLQGHSLVVYTATPGSPSHAKLELLSGARP